MFIVVVFVTIIIVIFNHNKIANTFKALSSLRRLFQSDLVLSLVLRLVLGKKI
jgi:hypothetical protein